MTEKILEKREIVFEYTVKEIIHDAKAEPTAKAETATACLTFADSPVADINKVIRAGEYRKHFKVGDKRKITLKNGEKINIAIADFDHDVTEKDEVLPLTLTFVDCLSDTYPMNQTATNKSGWKGCAMRKTMVDIFELLPDEWQSIIVPCKKDNATVDKLFLPSEVEVWGKNYYGKDEASNKQYEFFKDKYNRIKFRTENEEYSSWWWLRSPYSGLSDYFCMVDSNGGYGNYDANYSIGVAPCFAIA